MYTIRNASPIITVFKKIPTLSEIAMENVSRKQKEELNALSPPRILTCTVVCSTQEQLAGAYTSRGITIKASYTGKCHIMEIAQKDFLHRSNRRYSRSEEPSTVGTTWWPTRIRYCTASQTAGGARQTLASKIGRRGRMR